MGLRWYRGRVVPGHGHCRPVPEPNQSARRCCNTRQRCMASSTNGSSCEELRRRLSRKPIQRSDLSDPATIGSSHDYQLNVQDSGGELSLERYMQLPVEQYYELDPEMIRPLGGRVFALTVPRTELLGVWVEPLVEIEVSQTASQVVLKATNCRIHGSDLVQRLNLDQRFCVMFQTHLTWTPAPQSAGAAAQALGPARPPPEGGESQGQAAAGGWMHGFTAQLTRPFQRQESLAAREALGLVKAHAKLEVSSEVIAPFNLMPRGVLESAGSAVMAALLRSLLPLFLRKLLDDYRKWATDSDYRRRRMLQPKAGVHV